MEANKNLSIENLTEWFEGVLYVEEWKDIPGYEGKYQISSFGRVKSIKYQRGNIPRIMKLASDAKGYQILTLCKNGKKEMHSAHVLVAELFIKNPEIKKTVQHKGYVTSDNRIHQLEWYTHKEQNQDAWKSGRREHVRAIVARHAIKAYGPRKKKVCQYSLLGNLIAQFDCLLDAAKAVNSNKVSIWACAAGRQKTSAGFRWNYNKYKKLPKELIQ